MSNKINLVSNNNCIITAISTNNNITKRPYTNNTYIASTKKTNNSNSFKNTLNSLKSNKTQHSDSKTFSPVISNNINDEIKLHNQKCCKTITSNSNEDILNDSTSEKNALTNKLNDSTNNSNIDMYTIYEKISKLNSLKKI
ncbi:hypothetical protein CLOBY_13270 [Clostridium saccharobutylicum]|uniref:hypothetical protein n=1 Tax=Clostridium saccharobutylicum TaxID=169679 RepID=UPI000983E0FF|nr:hypothetical protein [Clostridium saccharobutylicum]AQS09204.1 hypothetical protein CLOBY_13270 [Clostridium saccharobutylicum]MBC2435296.1 hypothetical protein [Clostridium saccharobutylicum]NSB87439.1 hypothetical protein [Clostridium saccharobutylicum]NYC28433.1 hypothetical protein [Clostridium saccharobutylicum]OOM15627.1 hypothetical protein CLSAB_24690 [Clostridium saccharobutylicum]